MVPRITRNRQVKSDQPTLSTAFDAVLGLVMDAHDPKFLMADLQTRFDDADSFLRQHGWDRTHDSCIISSVDLLASGTVMSLFDAFIKVPSNTIGVRNQIKGAHQDAAEKIVNSAKDDLHDTRFYRPANGKDAAFLLNKSTSQNGMFEDVCCTVAFGTDDIHDAAIDALQSERVWHLFKSNITSNSNDARAVMVSGSTRIGGRDASNRTFRGYVTSAARALSYQEIGVPPCHVWLSSQIQERFL